MREIREKRWPVPFMIALAVCAGLFLAAALSPAERKLGLFTVSTGVYLAFCVAAAVFFTLRRAAPEKPFALLALLFGLAYLLLITPLSVPDEDHHYRMSCVLSNFLLFRWQEPWLVPEGYLDYTGWIAHQNVSSGYLRVLSDLFAPLAAGEMVQAESTLGWGFYLPYLPQTVGVAAGRLLGLGIVPVFLLGRLCNLLFYTLCVYLAVRRAPRYKVTLGVAALLPMAMQQAASFSYDGYTNGIALCFTAQLLGCMLEEGRLPRRDFWRLLALSMLLAPAKVMYVPLVALVLLIPARRFRSPWRKWAWLGWLLVCAALTVLLFQTAGILRVGASGGDGINWEGEHNYSLVYVLEHPGTVALIFWNTIRYCWFNWLYTLVGGALSGLSLLLPANTFYTWAGFALVSGSGLAERERLLGAGQRLAFLAAGACVMLLCMGVMLLSWTSESQTIIQGVQGRYFLPTAAVLFIAIGIPVRTGALDLRPAFGVTAAVLHAAALWYVLQYTLLH